MVAANDVLGHFSERDGFGWGVDAEEIRKFFCDYDATIGFRSTFSAMIAAWVGVGLGEGAPAGWDPYAEILPRIVEGSRVYRKLRNMGLSVEDGGLGDTNSLVVLWKLYGPRNGRTERTDFGSGAPGVWASLLVGLTDAAEEARADAVLRESTERSDDAGRLVATSQKQACKDLEWLFWREAAVVAKLTEKLGRARKDTSRTRINKRLAAGRQLMGQIVDAVMYDGTLRARLGAIESTDHELTVEGAVRGIMDKPRSSTREAHEAWRARRDAFVTSVRIEANRMRREAHEAYRKARS